jgi:hypothetical protein
MKAADVMAGEVGELEEKREINALRRRKLI